MASRIIDDAELRAKNEAMRRTNRAVEHIISEAKEEAIRIVAKASQIAEKRAGQIITDSRREKARADFFEITPEAEPGTSRLAKKAIDKAKKVTEQSARVIAGVKQKAKGACQGS